MNRYNYKKPRSINLVSVALVLLAVAAAYAGWKFIPHYWRAQKVDEALSDVGYRASDLYAIAEPSRRKREADLVEQARERLQALGVDDPLLNVWFEPGRVHASYTVIVKHLFTARTTTLRFHRKGRIPGDIRGVK